MADAHMASHGQHSLCNRSKSHRLSAVYHKLRHRKTDSRSEEQASQPPIDQSDSAGSLSVVPSRLSSIAGVRESVPAAVIAEEYSSLHDSITSHVRRFYAPRSTYPGVTQTVIEHASTGVMVPWFQIRSFLDDRTTTLATLSLCITWAILSRSLLLKLGISNSSGSSFLPPEIVALFQSFSLGKGAITALNPDEVDSVTFALLSRWKQLSATLSHSTYVQNAFSHFDSRTTNIERALNDLDPLLSTYAIQRDDTHHSSQDARLSDLRYVLRKGAQFAFTLFGQSSFWKFDWSSDRAVRHGKAESQRNLGRIPSFETGMSYVPVLLAPSEIVIWPTLLRVMDSEGKSLQGLEGEEGNAFGEKRYLLDSSADRGK
ncbi:hypothetical protein DM02DRAFT_91747 [Periconia macrospinosa]|uniref:Uncharacterized protein n=1 Tax=Periconia macrospinosa TaxID=97972 RepID=A0A2V1DGG9_9PLEO|nr:hypothetical protein DM02DRAFT_91747 [Periconia macrospinosa]